VKVGLYSIKEIIKATRGDLITGSLDLKVGGISTDTRTLFKGDLFIALKGEKFDGHCFLEEALKKGAVGAVISEKVKSEKITIKVKDTLQALGDIAKIHREKFSKIKVIAVTGSNGKTTTKEMLGFCLSKRFNVLKAKASFNNFVGVPLTLLEVKKDTRIVILEMETNILGGIRRLADVAKPSVGIVTNIGDTHLQFLKTRENVFKEKAELIKSLPDKGIAVLNSDDPYIVKMKELAKGRRVITFGIKNKSDDFRASHIKIKDMRLEFILNDQYKIRLNTILCANVYNALSTVAATHSVFGLNLKAVAAYLEEFRFPPMRMELVRLKDIEIINDCYNANPQSMREALLTFKNIHPVRNTKSSRRGNKISNGVNTSGRRIAVLGDMLELGQNSADFHYQLGKLCGTCQIDILVTVGNLAQHIANGAKEAGMLKKNILNFDDTRDAAHVLSNILKPKDVILIKGSRKMDMGKIVEWLNY